MKLEPFRVGRLESEEITGLAGVVGAVHVGVEEDVEVWREVQLVQCKNVAAVVGVPGSWRRLRRWLHAQQRSAGSGGEWRVSSQVR